jgi:hypothetical protein
MSFMRAASKVSRVAVRTPVYRAPVAWTSQRAFSQSAIRCSDQHAEETFEEFTARYDASQAGFRARAAKRAVHGPAAAIELH